MSLTGWQHVKFMHFFPRQKFNVGLQRGKSDSLVIRPRFGEDLRLFFFRFPIQRNGLTPIELSFLELRVSTIYIFNENKSACL